MLKLTADKKRDTGGNRSFPSLSSVSHGSSLLHLRIGYVLLRPVNSSFVFLGFSDGFLGNES